jgi:hypothetical protein
MALLEHDRLRRPPHCAFVEERVMNCRRWVASAGAIQFSLVHYFSHNNQQLEFVYLNKIHKKTRRKGLGRLFILRELLYPQD